MLIVALRKGGSPCSKDCPYYTDSGIVRGVNDVPLATHCRATMETVIIDCDVWNPNCVEKLQVTEDEWQTMQQSVHKRARKERKLYDPDHAEIHPVGYNWKHQDKWNAKKSANV